MPCLLAPSLVLLLYWGTVLMGGAGRWWDTGSYCFCLGLDCHSSSRLIFCLVFANWPIHTTRFSRNKNGSKVQEEWMNSIIFVHINEINWLVFFSFINSRIKIKLYFTRTSDIICYIQGIFNPWNIRNTTQSLLNDYFLILLMIVLLASVVLLAIVYLKETWRLHHHLHHHSFK